MINTLCTVTNKDGEAKAGIQQVLSINVRLTDANYLVILVVKFTKTENLTRKTTLICYLILLP